MLYLNSRVDVIDIGDAGISLNEVRSYTAQSVYLSQRVHNLIIDFLRRFHHNSPIELVLCLARCSRIGPFLLPMPIPETAFVWPFPDYPAFSRAALLSSRGVSGSDFSRGDTRTAGSL